MWHPSAKLSVAQRSHGWYRGPWRQQRIAFPTAPRPALSFLLECLFFILPADEGFVHLNGTSKLRAVILPCFAETVS